MKRELSVAGLSLLGVIQLVYIPYAIVTLTQSLKWNWDRGLANSSFVRNGDLAGYILSYIAFIVLSIFVYKDFKIVHKLIAAKDHKHYLKSGFLLFVENMIAIVVFAAAFLALLWYHCQKVYC
ncbi:hypothetical protein HYU93_03575 [Candidatus Daviesbacteria bacterium]|nr:hypothetical protein [Candidatus Daviesbacteria bacterium]